MKLKGGVKIKIMISIVLVILCVLLLSITAYGCEKEKEVIAYEQEILPDGLYFYCVQGAYLTVGVQTIGNTETEVGDKRVCCITYYGTTDGGQVVCTEEDIVVQTKDKNVFTSILKDGHYDIVFNDCGTVDVVQITDDIDTELSFENTYIYLYSFEDTTVAAGELDY